MQDFWEEHNRKIAEIDSRHKRYNRILFICAGIFIAAIFYRRFFLIHLSYEREAAQLERCKNNAIWP
jgi:hypothetical protein